MGVARCGLPVHAVGSTERITPKESTMSTDKKSKKLPTARAYREAAKRLHHVEGECEIDDNAKQAKVSRTRKQDEEGAYVQAWVWVPREEVDDSYDPSYLGPSVVGPSTSSKGCSAVSRPDHGREDGAH